MRSDPVASVVVPVFNGARYLREALESAFAQRFTPFEVIVVDDGSIDDTPSIAHEFPAVRYVWQPNGGPALARNTALELARGSYIAFLDSDDVLTPNKLEVQAAYLDANPGVGCVLGRHEWIFDGVEPPAWLTPDPIYGEPGGIQLVTAMIRRDAIDAVGGFDSNLRYAEDRDLLIRLRAHGVQIDVLPDVVLRKRLHGSNLTMSPPGTHPMMRTLQAKVARERATRESEAE